MAKKVNRGGGSSPVWKTDGLDVGGLGDAESHGHKSAYEVGNGTLAFTVTAEATRGLQGLVSKDHKWFGDGGHLTVWLANGEIRARLQSEDREYVLQGGSVKAGEPQAVAVSFGDGGFKLYVGGEIVDQNRYTGGLEGNREPIVVGASQWGSGEGKSAKLEHEFKGEIADVALYDVALPEAAIRALTEDRGEPAPSDPEPDPGNAVPVVAGALGTIKLDDTERAKLDLWKLFSDADGDRLEYSIEGAPDFSWISKNNRWLMINPDKGDSGKYDFTVRASDGEKSSKPLTAKVEVEGGSGPGPAPKPDPENAAPVAKKQLGEISLGEGGKKIFTLKDFFADADGDDIAFLLKNAPDFVKLVDGKLVIAPKDGDDGNAGFSVVASDGEDQAAPMPVKLKIADKIRDDGDGDGDNGGGGGGPVSELVKLSAGRGILENKIGAQEWGEGVVLRGYGLDGKLGRVLYSEEFRDHTFGVDGSGSRWKGQIDYYEKGGGRSEKLEIDFNGDVTDVVLKVGMMGFKEGPGDHSETGRWTAYDEGGGVVGRGLIGPDQSALGPNKKQGGYGIYPIEIEPDEAFERLVIEATGFGHGEGRPETKSYGENNSDIGVMGVEFLRLEPVDDFLF